MMCSPEGVDATCDRLSSVMIKATIGSLRWIWRVRTDQEVYAFPPKLPRVLSVVGVGAPAKARHPRGRVLVLRWRCGVCGQEWE